MHYGDSQYAAPAAGSLLLGQNHVLDIFRLGADYYPMLYFNLHSTHLHAAPVVAASPVGDNVFRAPDVLIVYRIAGGRHLETTNVNVDKCAGNAALRGRPRSESRS